MDASRSTPCLLAALVTATLVLLVTGANAPATADPGTPDQTAPAAGVWPLRPEPTLVRGFDPPETRWGAGHRGVDLAGRAEQQVLAALAGTVTFAGPLAGRGVVVVDHGGTRTTYEPVQASVTPGDAVDAGDPIGRLEAFGSHCAPAVCLHWGLLDGAHYLDPLTLVGRGPVRLLPLLGDPPLAAAGSTRPDENGLLAGGLAASDPDRATAPGPVRPLETAPLGMGPLFRQLAG
jgi:murein DD-endopeptidase MepM/ murein hydrolase activator NlpD